MLSFTEGRKIAIIKGGKRDKKFVYLSLDNPKDGRSEIILDKNEMMVPLPNKQIVEKIYISAPSGSGKSYWAGKWIKQYKKMFADNEIYLFSSIEKDKELDIHGPIRIVLDQDLINDPISPEEVENSLVVLDDCDTIRDKKLNLSLVYFRDWLLEQGRHFNVRMLITSHLLSNYALTRRILNEATAVVVFPKSGSGTHQIKNFLKTYCGFDKNQISKFITLPSRWVAIYRSYPQYVIYEGGAYLPIDNDEK